MIIKHLRRIAATVITIATVFAASPIAAHAEWKQDSTGWWYADGNSWYTGWKQVDGKWYYFDSNGYMAHDQYIGNYYLNSQGYWDASVGTTSTNTNAASQGFSVQYPSSWTKATIATGTIYYLDDKKTSVNEKTASIQGASRQDFLNESVKNLKNTFGTDQVDISQQTINGKTVDVLDYKFKDTKTNDQLQIHQVVFYNNSQIYIFTLGGIADISSVNMDSFNDMLKTVTF